MKKRMIMCLLIGFVLLLSGCGNKYEGYWCKYSETASIVILLDDEITDEQKLALEAKFGSYTNLLNFSYFDKQAYGELIGVENPDVFNSYFVSFNSTDGVGTYVEEIEAMSGVREASESSAKVNFELYHLDKGNKYTFSNSDEIEEKDIVKGKYKIKKGIITFVPEGEKKTDSMLYTKGEHLCGNPECTIVFAKSNSTCGSNKE